jgi:hypothetical protein
MPPMIRSALMLLPLLALGACQSTGMSARAPSGGLAAPGAGLTFLSVQGPDAATAKKFEGILAEEAKRRGYAVGSGMQVKTFLDGFPTPDGKTGFSWVLDASGDGRTRLARAKGTAMLGAANANPWGAFDEAAMRQVARMSLDDLTRNMQGGGATQATAAPTTTDE